MLSTGDRVLVGISGGPDSVALLRVLQLLAGELSLSLALAHVNYHLRGRASAGDERFCRELAAQAGVPVYVRSRHKPRRAGKSPNTQDWARRERYAVYNSLADRHGFTRIAVGHTFDDQVETVAGGLFGGRDSFALTGIPRVRGRIVRPLFDCRRPEILAFLGQLGQPYREDTSNRDPGYLRNWVRHHILPQLRRDYHPRLDDVLFRWSGLMAQQRMFFEKEAARRLARLLICRGNGWLSLDLSRLRRAGTPLDYYLLLECARLLGIDNLALSAAMLNRFRQLAASGLSGRRLVWGKLTLEVSRTALSVYLHRPTAARQVEINLAGSTPAAPWGLQVTCRLRQRKTGAVPRLPRGALRFNGDAAQIRPPVVLREPRPGEKIKPMGMAGRKKIYDILSEAGVPGIVRERTPVFADRKGVFWVVGYRQEERVRVRDHTREILNITLADRSAGDGSFHQTRR